jgi:hypothetical protein
MKKLCILRFLLNDKRIQILELAYAVKQAWFVQYIDDEEDYLQWVSWFNLSKVFVIFLKYSLLTLTSSVWHLVLTSDIAVILL